MENKELHFYNNHFNNFNNGVIVYKTGVLDGFDIELFGRELKQLLEKHKIKSIYPTHRTNAQITRHVKDNELHVIGMIFEGE